MHCICTISTVTGGMSLEIFQRCLKYLKTPVTIHIPSEKFSILEEVPILPTTIHTAGPKNRFILRRKSIATQQFVKIKRLKSCRRISYVQYLLKRSRPALYPIWKPWDILLIFWVKEIEASRSFSLLDSINRIFLWNIPTNISVSFTDC